jgi:predicted dehydrogenase
MNATFRTSRREFLKSSLATGLAVGLSRFAPASERPVGRSPNDSVQIAVIGLGAVDTIGGVGGRGHQLIGKLRQTPGVRIVAFCDPDRSILDRELRASKNKNEKVTDYSDIRQLLENKDVDAVAIATPNHWHALAAVWACQAGKDVYVEKPFSHDLWEGRQMVAAARKHGRVMQVGTQSRSSPLLRQAFDLVRKGELGAIRSAHAIVYRPRPGIGTVNGPSPVPETVDYDLWCGPAPKGPLQRKQLHYEWHWFWQTGNGEMGNNGVHVIDLCRWALGQNAIPPRAISIAGRFGVNDCAETPNTHIAFFDYQPAPILCEIRNLRAAKAADPAGRYRNRNGGIVIDCEGGYLAGDASGVALFDSKDARIREIKDDGSTKDLEIAHLSNFLDTIRSRNMEGLAADALEGHRSTSCCHLANISHRLGQGSSPEVIQDAIRGNHELADAFNRCQAHLSENGINLEATPAVLGPWVTFDPEQERFTGPHAGDANRLIRRDYRKPFVVPAMV